MRIEFVSCVNVREQSGISAFFLKGTTVGGKAQRLQSSNWEDYKKRMHSFESRVKNLLLAFFT